MKISITDLIMLIAQYENFHIVTFLIPFYFMLSNYVTILSVLT